MRTTMRGATILTGWPTGRCGGAAGIAAAPSAGASIAIGGMLTSGVLTVGGAFCK